MAFPTETTKRSLAFVLTEAQSVALAVKRQAQQISERSTTGNMTAGDILTYQERLKEQADRLDVLKATPGIGQFAKDQFNDILFDIVVEFDAMLLQMQGVLTWIRVNLPVSANGFVEERIIELDNTITHRTFSSAQASTFRAELNALVTSIN